MHIVFDLDETLIHSLSTFRKSDLRPHALELLRFCFANFESVSIWTAASDEWWLQNRAWHFSEFEFAHVFTANKCVYYWDDANAERERERRKCKPLIKFWRSKSTGMTRNNTIIVDDDHWNSIRNYGNAIIIPEWNGDENDSELAKLEERLRTVLALEAQGYAVREIDLKRGILLR